MKPIIKNNNIYKPRYKIIYLAKNKIWPYKNSRLRRFLNFRGRKLVRKGLFKRYVLVFNNVKWTKARRFIRKHNNQRSGFRKPRRYQTLFYKQQSLRKFYGKQKAKQFNNFFKHYLNNIYRRNRSFISTIERRLDITIYRARSLPTIFACHHVIHHHGVLINSKLQKSPNYLVKPGDIISFDPAIWRLFYNSVFYRIFWRGRGLFLWQRRRFKKRFKQLRRQRWTKIPLKYRKYVWLKGKTLKIQKLVRRNELALNKIIDELYNKIKYIIKWSYNNHVKKEIINDFIQVRTRLIYLKNANKYDIVENKNSLKKKLSYYFNRGFYYIQYRRPWWNRKRPRKLYRFLKWKHYLRYYAKKKRGKILDVNRIRLPYYWTEERKKQWRLRKAAAIKRFNPRPWHKQLVRHKKKHIKFLIQFIKSLMDFCLNIVDKINEFDILETVFYHKVINNFPQDYKTLDVANSILGNKLSLLFEKKKRVKLTSRILLQMFLRLRIFKYLTIIKKRPYFFHRRLKKWIKNRNWAFIAVKKKLSRRRRFSDIPSLRKIHWYLPSNMFCDYSTLTFVYLYNIEPENVMYPFSCSVNRLYTFMKYSRK